MPGVLIIARMLRAPWLAFPGALILVPPALLVLAALLAGCDREADAAHYFPLEPGRSWHYRIERTTMDGQRRLRHAVHSRVVPQGVTADALRVTLDGRPYLYAVDPQGIFRLNPPAAERAAPDHAEPVLILPHDFATRSDWQAWSVTAVLENSGPPWETLFRITTPVHMRYRVETFDATVETPAGRFHDCLLVSGQGAANIDVGNYIGRTRVDVATREWFAPGVGLVRMERDEKTGATALSGGRLVMELDRWRGP